MRHIKNPSREADAPNLELLFSALDLAYSQALHNGRVCGAEARELANKLHDAIQWAKPILVSAARGNAHGKVGAGDTDNVKNGGAL